VSYDITLFRVPDGIEPSLAHREIMERQEREAADPNASIRHPVSDLTRTEMQRISDLLQKWRPTLKAFHAENPLPWIELNDDDLQVQFTVHDGTVEVTMPYFRDTANEMIQCITESFTILSPEGYSAFDPQLGRLVTSSDLAEITAQYRGMDQRLPEIMVVIGKPPAANRKKWWRLW